MACESLHVVLLTSHVSAGDDDRSRSLAAKLMMEGFHVRVLCLTAAGPRDAAIPVIPAPSLARVWMRPWAVRTLPLATVEASAPALMHVICPEMADAGLAIAEHRRLPYVLTINDFPRPDARLRMSRRWCRRIVATGTDLADELVRQFGIPAEMLEVVPPGIPLPEALLTPLGSGRVPVIGTAGTLAHGVGTFLEAARQVVAADVDAEFVVAGHSGDEGNIRRFATHLGLAERVTFVEARGALNGYWQALDIYCQPSLIPSAGLMLSGALAYGLPAVVSEVPGLRAWIVPEESGLLIPPGDAAALARTILDLLANPARAQYLGGHGRSWIAEHCAPGREARTLAAAYQAILSQPPTVASPKMLRRDTAFPRS